MLQCWWVTTERLKDQPLLSRPDDAQLLQLLTWRRVYMIKAVRGLMKRGATSEVNTLHIKRDKPIIWLSYLKGKQSETYSLHLCWLQWWTDCLIISGSHEYGVCVHKWFLSPDQSGCFCAPKLTVIIIMTVYVFLFSESIYQYMRVHM